MKTAKITFKNDIEALIFESILHNVKTEYFKQLDSAPKNAPHTLPAEDFKRVFETVQEQLANYNK